VFSPLPEVVSVLGERELCCRSRCRSRRRSLVSLGRVENHVDCLAEVVPRVRENREFEAVVFGKPDDTEPGLRRAVTRPHLDVALIDVLSRQALHCVGDTGEVRMSDIQLVPINFIGFCSEME